MVFIHLLGDSVSDVLFILRKIDVQVTVVCTMSVGLFRPIIHSEGLPESFIFCPLFDQNWCLRRPFMLSHEL